MLPEKHILRCADGQVTFRYTDNQRRTRTRTLAGADFLWLLLCHVLPKGFRRSRDYGLLHGNRKRLIAQLHLMLKVVPPLPPPKIPRCCRECGGTVRLSIIPFMANLRIPPPPLMAAVEAAM